MAGGEDLKRASDWRKRQLAEERKLRGAVDAVLQTESGREVFKHLFHICGYNKTSIVADPRTGAVAVDGTVYNEGRRSVYIQLRLRASRALLTPVEEAAEEAEWPRFDEDAQPQPGEK